MTRLIKVESPQSKYLTGEFFLNIENVVGAYDEGDYTETDEHGNVVSTKKQCTVFYNGFNVRIFGTAANFAKRANKS